MVLKDYLLVVWRRKWIVIITISVTMILVVLGTRLITPIYAATATLRIATAAGGTVSYTDYVYNDRLVNTYVRIATSRPVLDELVKKLGLDATPTVRVEIVTNTELINITIEHSDPLIAQQAANALALILIEQSKALYTGGGKDPKEILAGQLTQIEQELSQGREEYEALVRESPSDSEAIAAASRSLELKQNTYATLLEQYEETRLREALRANTISLVEPAILPTKPDKPNLLINYGLALMLSGLAGLGLVFLFDHFDTRLQTSEQIEAVAVQKVIGKIPGVARKRAYLTSDGSSPYGEAYRRLRIGVLRYAQEHPLHTLMVTSAEPEEGKSTVAANLSILLAQTGKQVVLVDCDTNLPAIHAIFGLSNEYGLSDLLSAEGDWEQALQESGIAGLRILPSGKPLSDASDRLRSEAMRNLLKLLCEQADIVVLDSSALLEVADAAALAPEVDGVVLIVRQGMTRRETLHEACEQLNLLKARTIGVVVTHTEQNGRGSYYYGHRKSISRAGVPGADKNH